MYVELTKDDAQKCTSTNTAICKFHTPVGRSLMRNSCALALLLDHAEKQTRLCKRRFIEWRGTEAVFLGRRRWAISSTASQEVVITCPSQVSSRTIKVPRIGLFEIPPTCSARTADWIFPGSTEGKLETRASLQTPPPLSPLLLDQTDWTINYQDHSVVELTPLNASTLD